MSRRRSIQTKRRVKRVVWLIVEGETELYYFTGLRNDPKRPKPNPPVAITVKCAGGRNAQHVVNKADGLRRAQGRDGRGQEFYCVFDVEDHTPEKRGTLEQALRDAADKGLGVVLSNPCFEVWLHCHRDGFTPRQFVSCDECVNELCKAWSAQRISASPYAKGDARIYDKLAHRLRAAIDTARQLREVHHRAVTRSADANASTDVYRLVGYLQGLASDCRPCEGSAG